jgi:[ribosomal protein S5]-alanine N-acetyltransferase
MHSVTLTTERLTLRPVRVEDAEPMAALLGPDLEGVRMTARIPDHCTVEDIREWIGKITGADERAFAITETASGTVMGSVGYAKATDGQAIGYWIGRPFRGRGYASEAAAAVLAHMREQGIGEIFATALPINTASARILIKLGFRCIGQVERYSPQRGGKRIVDRYRLDRPESYSGPR